MLYSFPSSGHGVHPRLAPPPAVLRRGHFGARGPIGGPGGAVHQQGVLPRGGGARRPLRGEQKRVAVGRLLPGAAARSEEDVAVISVTTHTNKQTSKQTDEPLTCFCLGAGDGEAAGSHGNGPLPPLLPAAVDSGPAGPPPTDLPASPLPPRLRLLRRRLLPLLLRGPPPGAAPPQPRAAAASVQAQQPPRPHRPPAAALHLHLPGRRRRHASSDPAQGPRLLPAGLPLLLAPPAGAAAAAAAAAGRLPGGVAPSSPLRLPAPGVRTPGRPSVLQLVLLPRSSHAPFGAARSLRLLLLVRLHTGTAGL